MGRPAMAAPRAGVIRAGVQRRIAARVASARMRWARVLEFGVEKVTRGVPMTLPSRRSAKRVVISASPVRNSPRGTFQHAARVG